MASVFETIISIRFIKLMAKKFEQWPAFKHGIIDKDGATLRSPETAQEKKDFGLLHVLVRNIKIIVGKLPGGKSMVGSYMAALWLLKEQLEVDSDDMALLIELYFPDKIGAMLAEGVNEDYSVLTEVRQLDRVILDRCWFPDNKYRVLVNIKELADGVLVGRDINESTYIKFVPSMMTAVS